MSTLSDSAAAGLSPQFQAVRKRALKTISLASPEAASKLAEAQQFTDKLGFGGAASPNQDELARRKAARGRLGSILSDNPEAGMVGSSGQKLGG